jgi:hypothetical protein
MSVKLAGDGQEAVAHAEIPIEVPCEQYLGCKQKFRCARSTTPWGLSEQGRRATTQLADY